MLYLDTSLMVAALAVASRHFRTAAKFVDHHTLGLRAGDALHLAIASEHGASVHTLDRRLSEAGPRSAYQRDCWRERRGLYSRFAARRHIRLMRNAANDGELEGITPRTFTFNPVNLDI